MLAFIHLTHRPRNQPMTCLVGRQTLYLYTYSPKLSLNLEMKFSLSFITKFSQLKGQTLGSGRSPGTWRLIQSANGFMPPLHGCTVHIYGLCCGGAIWAGGINKDFPVNRFFMKLFNTSNIQMVNNCQVYFGFDLPSVIIGRQSMKFMSINATYTVS